MGIGLHPEVSLFPLEGQKRDTTEHMCRTSYLSKCGMCVGFGWSRSDGQEFLMKFFDDFKVEGPNGTHQCIVSEVLGPSIGTDVDEIYDEEWYPIEIAKMLVAQVIRGVAYLHSCGVVHGGKRSLSSLEVVFVDIVFYRPSCWEHTLAYTRDRATFLSGSGKVPRRTIQTTTLMQRWQTSYIHTSRTKICCRVS